MQWFSSLRIMFLNVKLWSFGIFHHLEHMMSSKVSENLETSLRAKGHIWKSILNGHDLWALWQHCTKNREDSVMEITAWDQKHFQKSLSVNTDIKKRRLELYHAKKKLYVNMIRKCYHLLWVKDHSKWTEEKWCTALSSDESNTEILFLNHRTHNLWTREKRDHLACYQHSVQRHPSLMVWGC